MAAITNIAILTNTSLKILEKCQIHIQNIMINLSLLVIPKLKNQIHAYHSFFMKQYQEHCQGKDLFKI